MPDLKKMSKAQWYRWWKSNAKPIGFWVPPFWDLKNGQWLRWEEFIRNPALQDQLADKKSFRRWMKKIMRAQRGSEA